MTNITLPRTLALASLAALTLSACQKNGTADQNATDNSMTAANTAAPVELPPAIKQSATLRCADNSVIYIDFYSDNKSASVRKEQTGQATRVTASDETTPMTSTDGGTIVKGHQPPVTVTLPGKSAQLCKA